MTRNALSLFLVSCAASTPTLAQTASPTFTGPRAEGDVDWNEIGFDLSKIGSTGRSHGSDIGYGGNVGYDVALSSTVIAGVDLGILGSENRYVFGTSTTGGTLRERRELDASARLGTRIGPNALLYARLGYANLQVRQATTASSITSGTLRDVDGVLAGVGGEYALTRKTFAKLEYRYTNYASGYEGNTVLTGLGIRF